MPKYVNLIAFLQKLISKEHVVVIIEFPVWVQVKKKYTIPPGNIIERSKFLRIFLRFVRGRVRLFL